MQLLIFVVIYNLSPQDSATLQSLAASVKMLRGCCRQIIVRDNSSRPYDELQRAQLQAMLQDIDVSYWHDGTNLPLSRLYNTVIREQLLPTDFLLLLDHDTTFDGDFFSALGESLQHSPSCNLFLPIVKQGNDIVSPSYLHLCKGSYWKTEKTGLISVRHHNAINSGMVISGRYLKQCFNGYDERLLFYGTDQDFFQQYSQTNSQCYVLPYVLQHSLNFYDPKESFEKKAARLREIRRAGLILARKRGVFLWLLTYLYFDAFSIKTALRLHEPRYLLLR